MKKYFLLTAISAALFLTACGSNNKVQLETASTTMFENFNDLTITETTFPDFEPELEETTVATTLEVSVETELTSPAYFPEEATQTTTLGSTSLLTEAVVSETTVQTTATEPIEEEDVFFEAYVYGVEENSILVGMKGDTFIGPDGAEVYIFGKYAVEQGDTINIVFADEVGIDECYPPEIHEEFIVSIEKIECAQGYDLPYDSGEYDIPSVELGENQYVAYVTDFFKNKNGGYSLTVEAYDVMGYNSPVPISMHSETKFFVGDWVRIEFAPETCFMETSPLQVAKQDIVGIELIDY